MVAARYGEGEAAGPTALAVAGAAGERARLGELEGVVLLGVRSRGRAHGAVAADRVAAGVGLRGGRVGGVGGVGARAGLQRVALRVRRRREKHLGFVAQRVAMMCGQGVAGGVGGAGAVRGARRLGIGGSGLGTVR